MDDDAEPSGAADEEELFADEGLDEAEEEEGSDIAGLTVDDPDEDAPDASPDALDD